MAIVRHAHLRAELHCLSDDRLVVITAQQWFDPQAPGSRPVSWIRLVRNGRVRQDRKVVGVDAQFELQDFWAERAAAIRPARLDEEQMWMELARLTGIQQTECVRVDCSARLPVAWWYCPDCGRDARRVGAGSLLNLRGQGDLRPF